MTRPPEMRGHGERSDHAEREPQTYDPLRLCVYTTVAAIAWLLGPFAVLGFAALGIVGYARARRRGLTHSSCILRDTRVVLLYLGMLAAGAAVAIGFVVNGWLG